MTLAQVLSCKFCKISKNTFFIKNLRVTASVQKINEAPFTLFTRLLLLQKNLNEY